MLLLIQGGINEQYYGEMMQNIHDFFVELKKKYPLKLIALILPRHADWVDKGKNSLIQLISAVL